MKRVSNVDKLKLLLIERTGIDFEQFKDNELTDKLSRLISPMHALKSILCAPIICVLINFFTAWYVYSVTHALSGLLLILFGGLLLACVGGLSLGIFSFLNKLTNDILQIITLAFNLSKKIIQEISKNTINRLQEKVDVKLPSVSEIVSGVLFVVVLPTLTNILKKRIPLFGNLISKFIANVFDSLIPLIESTFASDDRVLKIDNAIREANNVSQKVQEISQFYGDKIDDFIENNFSKIEKLLPMLQGKLNQITSKATRPFKLITSVCLILYVALVFILIK